MRYALVGAVLFVATACPGADDLPKVTRVLEGMKTTFPEKSIPEGVKVFIGVIEACHDMSDGTLKYTADDLKKAQKGDHVRFVFPKPLGVNVLGEKKLEVSEAVFAKGAFWLLCGKEVVRCTKYKPDKWDRFREWYMQTLPVD